MNPGYPRLKTCNLIWSGGSLLICRDRQPDGRSARMGLFLSIDTGGTHTDIVAIDQRRRQLVTHKVPTTPGEPARGVLAGIRSALQRIGATFADVQRLV